MSNRLNKIGQALTATATGLSIHSYYLTLQDRSLKNLIESYRLEQEKLGEVLVKLAEDSSINEIKKINFIKAAEIEISKMQKLVEQLKNGKTNKETLIESINNNNPDWSKNTENSLDELKRLVDNYKGSGSSSYSNFLNNSNLLDEVKKFFESYLDWFNNLNVF
jgi:hypothetical protein